jgi:hypothetical protein
VCGDPRITHAHHYEVVEAIKTLVMTTGGICLRLAQFGSYRQG